MTLREKIQQEMRIGQGSTFEERVFWVIKDHVAQKFGTAMLTHNDHNEIFDSLFNQIFDIQKEKTDPNQ